MVLRNIKNPKKAFWRLASIFIVLIAGVFLLVGGINGNHEDANAAVAPTSPVNNHNWPSVWGEVVKNVDLSNAIDLERVTESNSNQNSADLMFWDPVTQKLYIMYWNSSNQHKVCGLQITNAAGYGTLRAAPINLSPDGVFVMFEFSLTNGLPSTMTINDYRTCYTQTFPPGQSAFKDGVFNFGIEVKKFIVTYNVNGVRDLIIDNTGYVKNDTVIITDLIPNMPGCTFTGWLSDFNGVTYTFPGTFIMPDRNVELVAQCSINAHTITYLDEDGSLIINYTANYNGNTPKPADPTKQATPDCTYTFAGWTPAWEATVTGNKTYTASYTCTTNSYTVTWTNDDGTVLDTEDYDYGDLPTYKQATPTKPATAQYRYTFTSWAPAVVSVTGNATYVATYIRTVISYTVTFRDWNGNILRTQTVPYGGSATAPVNPTRGGYYFVGWDRGFGLVTSNITVWAQYNLIPVVIPYIPPYYPPVQPPIIPVVANVEPEPVPEPELPAPVVPVYAPRVVQQPAEQGEVLGVQDERHWALVNLILTIGTVLASIIVIIRYFTGKKDEEEERAEGTTKTEVNRRGAIRALSIIPAVGAVIAFILTEDMTLPMGWVDWWTILMVVIAVIQIVVLRASKRKIKKDRPQAQKVSYN